MPRRKKVAASVPKTTGSADRLGKMLAKRKKAELIDVIMEIARTDRAIMRHLETQFAVEAPPKQLVAVTRQAVVDGAGNPARSGR